MCLALGNICIQMNSPSLEFPDSIVPRILCLSTLLYIGMHRSRDGTLRCCDNRMHVGNWCRTFPPGIQTSKSDQLHSHPGPFGSSPVNRDKCLQLAHMPFPMVIRARSNRNVAHNLCPKAQLDTSVHISARCSRLHNYKCNMCFPHCMFRHSPIGARRWHSMQCKCRARRTLEFRLYDSRCILARSSLSQCRTQSRRHHQQR